MKPLAVLLSAVVLLAIAGWPFAYARLRHETYRNFRVVEEGQLYRSGQMSAAGFERMCREKGIRTVVKLRDEDETDPKDVALDDAQEAFCQAHGIALVRLPTRKWEVDPITGKVPMEENLRAFEQLMATTPRPVLVHCFAGIHRTGAHVAAYRLAFNGWTNAEAVEELKNCGTVRTKYTGNMLPFVAKYRPQMVGEGDRRR
ncbi:MAG: tyrosine-protein phosphatase [Fimbriiglobus sp.]|jgi:protein tyrosine/serine phosphatase|nr:tyrosine-protein phosphatase [Fimbriiglobus sp.]